MKRALAVVVVLGLSSNAFADRRDAWQAAFAGSVTVALGGMVTWLYGVDKMKEAEDELCAGGAYFGCQPTNDVMLTQDDIDRLNAKGDHGSKLAYVGAAVTLTGFAVAGFTLYKGFIEKEEPRVVVTPTVSSDGAGAALSMRF